MRYENFQSLTIPKIGFGTWTIGGRDSADPAQAARSEAALRSALELGYTHFDTAEYYAGGHAEKLLGSAVRSSGLGRETLFIASKVSPEHLAYHDVLYSCEQSLRRLDMDYLDLYLIHWPMRGMDLANTFRALNKLVMDGKVRYLGVSNFDLKLLAEAALLSETKLLTNQVPYSLSNRTYARNGVLGYCQENGILLTAYSPVKHGLMDGSGRLKEIALSHGATSQQVALAWLVNQPCVITIPLSFNRLHQAENLAAAEIILSEPDMLQLTNLISF